MDQVRLRVTFLVVALAVAAAAGLACTAPMARTSEGDVKSGWERIGESRATHEMDYDEIRIRPHRGTFDRVQVYVDDYPVHLHDFTVHYLDGTSERFAVRQQLAAGSHTRAIHLSGHPRVLDRIEFTYQPNTNAADADGGQAPTARVIVYGRR